MFAIDYARRVLATLDAEVAAVATRMADGVPATEAHYRSMVGERRGLLRARGMMTEMFSEEERTTFDLNRTDR